MTLIKCPQEGCDSWFEPTKKHGYITKFCSRSCANSRKFTATTNKLKSQKNKEWYAQRTAEEKTEYREKYKDSITNAIDIWKQICLNKLMKSDIEKLDTLLIMINNTIEKNETENTVINYALECDINPLDRDNNFIGLLKLKSRVANKRQMLKMKK